MKAGEIRLDKWLWFARFCKSRSRARELAESGHVRINRVATAKADAPIKEGDVLTFPCGPDVRVVRVVKLGTRRGPAVEAHGLFEDFPFAAGAERLAKPAGQGE